MPEPFTRLARERLQHLATRLTLIHQRVRDAVASELGKAIGDSLRDLLTAVLTRQRIQAIRPEPSMVPPSSSPVSRWDDDDDNWPDEPSPPEPRIVLPLSTSSGTANAVQVGVGLATWLMHRKVPLLAGLGLGLAAGFATLSRNPLVQTAVAAITAAAELFAITELAAPASR